MPRASAGTPFAAPLDIRFIGIVGGRYSLSRAPGDDTPPVVYACRTQSLSPSVVVIAGPVGDVGQTVSLLLDQMGFLKGRITRRFEGGFQLDLATDPDEQKKLAAKINWLKKRSLRQAIEKRDAPRQRPRNPTAYFYLGDTEHECFIVDVSLTGAGISSTERPPIGTPLVLGQLSGRIVRHMEVGFGLGFDEPQSAQSLETAMNARRSPA